jgi:hypothetical protein
MMWCELLCDALRQCEVIKLRLKQNRQLCVLTVSGFEMGHSHCALSGAAGNHYQWPLHRQHLVAVTAVAVVACCALLLQCWQGSRLDVTCANLHLFKHTALRLCSGGLCHSVCCSTFAMAMLSKLTGCLSILFDCLLCCLTGACVFVGS